MFIEGSKVTMANGSLKNIETLQIGDQVLDYMNNIQTVDGIHNWPIDPVDKLYNINNKLQILELRVLFGSDNYFYRMSSGFANRDTYVNSARYVRYITGRNKLLWLFEWGMDENTNLLKNLEVGVSLQTKTGSEVVTSIEEVSLPAGTKGTLWRHSVTGSGTYFVNGFAVAARTNENWDYKNKKLYDGSFTIVNNTDTGVISREFNFNSANNTYPVWDYAMNDWNPSLINPAR